MATRTVSNQWSKTWKDAKGSSYISSSSVMAPFFANQSCDPFTPEARPCTLGNYVNYAINVTEPSDIVNGIAFATKNNIRLVIRNTGHEWVSQRPA